MISCDVQVGVTLTVILTLLKCDPDLPPDQWQPLDLSTQTSMEIVLLGPGGVRIVKSASFVTDGTDGKMTAVVNADEITVPGDWSIQGNAVLTGGIVHSLVKTFNVRANI